MMIYVYQYQLAQHEDRDSEFRCNATNVSSLVPIARGWVQHHGVRRFTDGTGDPVACFEIPDSAVLKSGEEPTCWDTEYWWEWTRSDGSLAKTTAFQLMIGLHPLPADVVRVPLANTA